MADSPTPSESSGAASAMERSILDAESKLAKLQDIQRAARAQAIILVGVVVLIMLTFGWRTYTQVRTNFDPETVQKEMLVSMGRLADSMKPRIVGAVQDAMPTYREQGLARLDRVMPRLQARVEAEIAALPEQIRGDLAEHLKGVMERVGMSIQKQTAKSFPYLTDDRAPEMVNHLVVAIDREIEKFVQRVVAITDHEQSRIAMALLELPAAEVPEGAHALEKRLAHELLMLLDYEIQAFDFEDKTDISGMLDGSMPLPTSVN